MIAGTPQPPYYAVIFTSLQSDDIAGYNEMATHIQQLAEQQHGYLGIESARDDLGITVSYWQDEAAVAAWKKNIDHQMAQKMGKDKWYQSYKVRVCKVQRDYEFTQSA